MFQVSTTSMLTIFNFNENRTFNTKIINIVEESRIRYAEFKFPCNYYNFDCSFSFSLQTRFGKSLRQVMNKIVFAYFYG